MAKLSDALPTAAVSKAIGTRPLQGIEQAFAEPTRICRLGRCRSDHHSISTALCVT